MQKFDVLIALEGLAEARAKFAARRSEFDSGVDAVMTRLLYEAAANFMSADEVARASGFTTAQIKTRMKRLGMNPTSGKTLIAKHAAEALAENSALLGIEPHEMDLMSPLAYLPMGSQLRAFLETPGVTDLDEIDPPRDRIAQVLYEEHFDREDEDWLSTVDGSPNAASYALADKILAALGSEA